MRKLFLYGCLPIVGLFVILIVYFLLEPKEVADARLTARIKELETEQDSAKHHVDVIVRQMQKVNQNIPFIGEESMGEYPLKGDTVISFLQSSVHELSQFTSNGFKFDTLFSYEPWTTQSMQTIENTFKDSINHWDIREVDNAYKEISEFKYIAVFKTKTYQRAYVTGKETFSPGYFEGWIIIMKIKTGELVCYAPFVAKSSEKIESFGVGVGVVGITIASVSEDMKKKVNEDFMKNFYDAAGAAIQGLRTGK